MKTIYRRLLIFVAALLVITIGYLGYRFYSAAQRRVPQEFSEARAQVTAISENIISNSNSIATLVARLSSVTSTPAQASSTLGEVLTKVGDVHDQAIDLSTTLEVMTKAVQDVRMAEAQAAALRAVSYRLSFVSRLVNYTEDVNRLALAIRLRLDSGIQNREEIANLILKINSEVAAANSLSDQADEAMDQVDALLC